MYDFHDPTDTPYKIYHFCHFLATKMHPELDLKTDIVVPKVAYI